MDADAVKMCAQAIVPVKMCAQAIVPVKMCIQAIVPVKMCAQAVVPVKMCAQAIMPNASRNSATAFLGQSGIMAVSCFHGFWDSYVCSSCLYALWNTCFRCGLIEL